ncbi:hypothetical protein [Rhodococcus erythropolis]|uniref:hypothetical protein n=1 Tax=Rhodococcus erythropolis TaxID=1833 RepID=UPI003F67A014
MEGAAGFVPSSLNADASFSAFIMQQLPRHLFATACHLAAPPLIARICLREQQNDRYVWAFIRLHRDDFRDDRICAVVSDAGSANSQRARRNRFNTERIIVTKRS